MSQAAKSHTTNVVNFKRATATLVLPAGLADALAELCILSAYSDGFTHTHEMAAATKLIADRFSPAVIADCLAYADMRERAYVTR